jgi:DNA-binding MarR family transcriptional regulator
MRESSAAETDVFLDFGILVRLFGFQMRRVQLRIYWDFMRDAPYPVNPGQFAIMVFIDRNPGLTQQQMCDTLRIEKSTLAVQLNRLSDRGLVRRERSLRDRRENALALTAQGNEVLKAMLEHVQKHERRVVGHMTKEERRTLMQLLIKLASPGRGDK